jgi:drug/metabolite transporter (DMT)-like permease
LLVIAVWGINFAVIKVGVVGVPPLLLGALRFLLAAFPALLFFKPPRVPLRWYLAYGLTISVGQFAFLFSAIHVGMPSGLASLVLQSQSFFTLLLAAWWLREPWRGHQVAGLLLALVAGASLALFSGWVPPGVEPGIAVSLLGLGLLVAWRVPLPQPVGLALVGVFALMHGAAHGTELQGAWALAGMPMSGHMSSPSGSKRVRQEGNFMRARGEWAA